MMGNKAQTTNKEEGIDLFLKEKGTDLNGTYLRVNQLI